MKKTFYTEYAYVFGMILMTFGAALSAKADFGMSMVVAPAYIIHLAVSKILPFFSFGMAEYILQGILIICTCIFLKKIKVGYALSMVTAILYGFLLDGVMIPVSLLPSDLLWQRIIWFIPGMLSCSLAVSMFFHTYISPEAYELVVKEISLKKGININKFKIGYDIISLSAAVILSLVFRVSGGVGIGTVIIAFVNGHIISFCSSFLDDHFIFSDKLPWRKVFER